MAEANETTEKMPFADAVQAISMAPHIHHLTEVVAPHRSHFTWAQAFEAVLDGIQGSSLTYQQLSDLKYGVRVCKDAQLKGAFVTTFEVWQAGRWEEAKAYAIRDAIAVLGNNLERAVFAWPQLRYEPELFEAVMTRAYSSKSISDDSISELALLQGSRYDLRVILNEILLDGRSLTSSPVIELINSWEGSSVWGRMMLALVSEDDERRPALGPIQVLARTMRQTPLDGMTHPRRSSLRNMSGASRAAWRSVFAEALAESEELRAAATEALLWFGADQEDRFVQLTAIHANFGSLSTIEVLTQHPSARLALRTRSAIGLVKGKPDPVDLLLTSEPRRTGSGPSTRQVSKTWLNDAWLEQLLLDAVSRATESMADEVRSTASAGEETLVAKLFERIRNACVDASNMAMTFARETDKTEYLHIFLDHRFVGKKEEGSPGLVAGGAFATDVTLIMTGEKHGKVFAERAMFIQAKRMSRPDSTSRFEHYSFDMQQIRDLVEQSASSFLLMVGPRSSDVTIPVMPGRLFLDRFDNGVQTKRLNVDSVASSGRSLADWLIDDVIGLWTGDPHVTAVEKAREGGGDRATLLVELRVAFRRLESDDDWHVEPRSD